MHRPHPTPPTAIHKIQTRNIHPTISSYDGGSKSIVVGANTSSITSAEASCNWPNSDCFSRPNRHSCASTTFSLRRTFAAQTGSSETSDGRGIVASIAECFRLQGRRLARPRIAITTGTTSPDPESIVAILVTNSSDPNSYKIQNITCEYNPRPLLPHQRPPDGSNDGSKKTTPIDRLIGYRETNASIYIYIYVECI